MTTQNETYVGTAPQSSGPKVRTLTATVLQSDGTTVPVLMQVVRLADEDGNIINLDDRLVPLLQEILQVLKDLPFQLKLFS